MKNYQFVRLLKRYLKRKSSHDEQSLIEGWYNYYAKQQKLNLPELDEIESDLDVIWGKISNRAENKSIKLGFPYVKVAAYAASVLLLISAGVWFYVFDSSINDRQVVFEPSMRLDTAETIDDYDVFVQMQSGDRLNLDKLSFGEEVSQERIVFQKNAEGELLYKSQANEWERGANSNKRHTVFVPKSKRSTLVLSDGSKVWLNSESSITFPELFSQNERVVEITGEAYFEVKKDVLKPFYVKTKDAVVKVLGTEFNVSTYDDEASSSTTLVSGAVSILNGQYDKKPAHTLVPGQQWMIDRLSRKSAVNQVDVGDIIAWREGKISFVNLDLQSIMRKVSRFYDVDVKFESYNKDQTFTGGITNKTSLDEFIKIMDMYQVKIEKNGKTLLVNN